MYENILFQIVCAIQPVYFDKMREGYGTWEDLPYQLGNPEDWVPIKELKYQKSFAPY